MKTSALFLLFTLLGLAAVTAQPPEYSDLETKAEALYAAGSYAKAAEVYQQARALVLPPAEARWVDFRLADTLWRSQAATQSSDDTKLEAAHHQLDVLVRDL